MKYPSIFNDVLGPVMRGPSSSHCAAALRIGRLCRDLMDGHIKDVLIEYDPNGSLATTHKSQGSDMGLFGGFLGWEADDQRLPHYLQGIEEAGIKIQINIVDIQADHPNTYKITLFNDRGMRELTALSTGGGMIQVISIDGAPVSIFGDYSETLIYTTDPESVSALLQTLADPDELHICRGRQTFVEVKSQHFLTASTEDTIRSMDGVTAIRRLSPVLPVGSRKNMTVPFINCEEMLRYNADHQLELWQLALRYESERGHLSEEEVWNKMKSLVAIMSNAVQTGLEGTTYHDRILGPQSLGYREKLEQEKLVPGDAFNRVILYVSAIMEVKSSMGVIVAAPTAGACGALPGAILGAASAMKVPEDKVIRAMLAAGMIGVFIAAHATFAAEVGGCQAECGSGSGMAAAGIVELANGNLAQALTAASMALQNSLGMICDPIANRVEAPCLGKNTMAATNALSMANMALADYDQLIPLDQVIDAMDKVGKSIDHELRCTGLGGLSATKASLAIEKDLSDQSGEASLQEAALRFKIC